MHQTPVPCGQDFSTVKMEPLSLFYVPLRASWCENLPHMKYRTPNFTKGTPFGTRLCLQSVVCYTCWRGWRRKRGAVLHAPRLRWQENRLNFCEWE